MNEKLIDKYKKTFDKISKPENHEEYKKVKEQIKNKCITDTKYQSKEYINLEIERLEKDIENKKSPYLSISYALIFAIISLLIPNLINLNNVSSSNEKASSEFNALFIVVMIIYLILVLFVFTQSLKKQEREFQCCIVYKRVLEELKQEIELNSSFVLSDSISLADIKNDTESIIKFLGIK